MNRRKFLKYVGLGCASVAVPITLNSKEQEKTRALNATIDEELYKKCERLLPIIQRSMPSL